MTYTPLQAHKIAERKLKRQVMQKDMRAHMQLHMRRSKMVAELADKTEALAALAHDNNKSTSLCRLPPSPAI